MSGEYDRDVQDWFDRSAEELSRQPFVPAVLKQVRRREQYLRWRRHAALLVALASFCLLLPELIGLLNWLATLPLAVVEVGSRQWPLLVAIASGTVYGLVRQARRMGLLPGT